MIQIPDSIARNDVHLCLLRYVVLGMLHLAAAATSFVDQPRKPSSSMVFLAHIARNTYILTQQITSELEAFTRIQPIDTLHRNNY